MQNWERQKKRLENIALDISEINKASWEDIDFGELRVYLSEKESVTIRKISYHDVTIYRDGFLFKLWEEPTLNALEEVIQKTKDLEGKLAVRKYNEIYHTNHKEEK